MTMQSCKNGATTLSRMNFSGYVGHVDIVELGLVRFSDWLIISGYAHVFVLLSVVSVTLPRLNLFQCMDKNGAFVVEHWAY